jgi:hypothetical protein
VKRRRTSYTREVRHEFALETEKRRTSETLEKKKKNERSARRVNEEVREEFFFRKDPLVILEKKRMEKMKRVKESKYQMASLSETYD